LTKTKKQDGMEIQLYGYRKATAAADQKDKVTQQIELGSEPW